MNRLSEEKSPYLIQHAGNPVDWYPWGDESFAKARQEDRPIFLSIGYSTCHWCHVMEAESFEDPEVAVLMNGAFISIKVDREERPDLDERFMAASMLLTGSGGWPLTIMMTPEGRPFFAATYIPRDDAYGRMGMIGLIPRIQEMWETRRQEILDSAEAIAAEMAKLATSSPGGFGESASVLDQAVASIARDYDSSLGGFGRAPKFPMPSVFPFLLRSWRRIGDPEVLGMVEHSLHALRNGGVYDQLGFGFHRYSTDAGWNVPHFEKMLYDQALEALAYTDAWKASGNWFYRRTAMEILDYALRDLALPEGGFASAEDADSEGVEGRFYTWTEEELRRVLGPEGQASLLRRYALHEGILRRGSLDESIPGEAEARLLQARAARPRPFLDDKLLADWNGLMIAALARAGAAFERPDYLAAAGKAASFILARMRGPGGILLHRYRAGEAAIPAFADDYAFLTWGFLELYEAGFEVSHLEEAIRLMDLFIARFWDSAGGGFQSCDQAGEEASFPAKPFSDGVLPSANSVALMALLKLNRITGSSDYQSRAEALISLYPADAGAHARSFPFFLSAVDFSMGPSLEIVIAGDPKAEDTRAMLRALRCRFLPNAVLVLRPAGEAAPAIARIAPYTALQAGLGGRATAYVCRDFACALPTADIEIMLSLLED
jgi:uncharacterized protein YyaL (SSP411 family)